MSAGDARRFRALPVSATVLGSLLLSVQLLPSFVRYVGADSSMVIGTALASLGIGACFAVTRFPPEVSQAAAPLVARFWPYLAALLACALVIPHALAASFFNAIDFGRFALTIPVLALILGGGLALGVLVVESSNSTVRRVLHFSSILLAVCALLAIFGLQPRAVEGAFEKSIFPFTETSHFALAFLPMVMYRCVSSSGAGRWIWLGVALLSGLLLQSLALLAGSLLVAAACRRLSIVIAGGLILALGAIPLELTYFADRLNLSSGTQNLSALVYLQGWQMLIESFSISSGWGVGFQQLGVNGTEVSAAAAIVALTRTEGSNLNDGGFVVAKLGSEFGVLGLLLAVLFLSAAWRSLVSLRREGSRNEAVVFADCVVVSFIIDMCVRGTGYFTGSTLLVIAALSVRYLAGRSSVQEDGRTWGAQPDVRQ
jgi:hypothetical protein